MNVPTFLDKESPQYKYDYFMALKHNISNTKVMAVLIHRLCGNYNDKSKAYFTDKFKQLKQWLFRSYRTEDIPQVAYTSLWKSWTIYKDTQAKKISAFETFYDAQILDLFPEEDRMYVSLTPISQPVYYLYKPEKVVAEVIPEKKIEDQPQAYDHYGNLIIPQAIPNDTIPIRSMFEYMFRNYTGQMKCECCRHPLQPETVALHLNCTHLVHRTCLDHYFCPLCE